MAAKAKKKTASKAKTSASKAKTSAKKTAASATSAAKNTTKSTINGMETFMMNGSGQFDKMAKDAASSGQEQFEAMIKSTQIFAKGMEDIVKTYMEIAQDSAEKTSEATREFLSCKTLDEFTSTQNKYAQASFDDMMSGATKLSEMSVKVCTDCLEPINDQVGKAMKKASQATA